MYWESREPLIKHLASSKVFTLLLYNWVNPSGIPAIKRSTLPLDQAYLLNKSTQLENVPLEKWAGLLTK